LPDTVVIQKVENPLVAISSNVVASNVIHGLRAVGKTEQPTVDELANHPLVVLFLAIAAAKDGIANHALEVLVPQSVEPALPEQIERY